MKKGCKKNLLVALADENYIDQAKQLFSSVYWNAGWKGDYMLLAHEIPEKKLKWFRKKGILIKKCEQLDVTKIVEHRRSPILLSKFYLFTEEFKKWKNVVYLDSDIIVRGSFGELTKIKGFAVSINNKFKNKLKNQFRKQKFLFLNKKNKLKKKLFDEIKKNYNLESLSFNSGIMAFSTNIIKKDTFYKLKRLFKLYGSISMYADQSILNLFFYKKYIKLSPFYHLHPNYMTYNYNIKPEKIEGIMLHFLGTKIWMTKPWHSKNYYYKEWKSNLDKVESIDLNKFQKPIKKWTKQEIEKKSVLLEKMRIHHFHRCVFWSIMTIMANIDRAIGLVGIFLKNNFLELYFKLKRLKEKK